MVCVYTVGVHYYVLYMYLQHTNKKYKRMPASITWLCVYSQWCVFVWLDIQWVRVYTQQISPEENQKTLVSVYVCLS